MLSAFEKPIIDMLSIFIWLTFRQNPVRRSFGLFRDILLYI